MLVVNYEQLLRVDFSCFHGQKLKKIKKNLHCRVCTKKLLDTKVKLFFLNLGSIFGGVKNWVFFRASCFGYRVKGACPLLLPLVSLVATKGCILYRLDSNDICYSLGFVHTLKKSEFFSSANSQYFLTQGPIH